jgi:hypothetical protein
MARFKNLRRLIELALSDGHRRHQAQHQPPSPQAAQEAMLQARLDNVGSGLERQGFRPRSHTSEPLPLSRTGPINS